jgi:hypothetical protein
MYDRNMVVEIKCNSIHFDRTMKSPSDFYRKLSNGKMSLGGPNQTNRSWWNRSIKGGSYSYRKTDELIEILFNVELKSENLLGVKFNSYQESKRCCHFQLLKIGGDELLKTIQNVL